MPRSAPSGELQQLPTSAKETIQEKIETVNSLIHQDEYIAGLTLRSQLGRFIKKLQQVTSLLQIKSELLYFIINMFLIDLNE